MIEANVPSLLLRNGQIYAQSTTPLTALLIEGASITWVGTEDGARLISADRTIDLHGRFVTPAFVDSHVHATGTGLSILGLDLADAVSKAEALRMVTEHCRGKAAGGVLSGQGWDESRWPENKPPTLPELDEACGGRQIYLTRVDAHSGLVSSALLRRVAGVRGALGAPATPDSAHARLAAYTLVHQYATAQISTAQRNEAQRAMLRRCAELGIGAVVEMAGPTISSEADLEALLQLASSSELIDVAAYWGELERIDIVEELGLAGSGGDLFCDGAIGSHTAALSTSYADRHDDAVGHLWLSCEQVAAHVRACTVAGVQAGFHAIGDLAVGAVIDGICAVADDLGESAVRRLSHRIEHCEMVGTAQIETMSRLGIVASMQPMFDRAWGGPGLMYSQRLGGRAASLNPIASLAAAGVPVVFGSDAPVTPLDPWASVHAAVFHRNRAQRISGRAAVSAMTRGGWRALRRSDGAGMLRPGAPAYLAIWNSDDLVTAAVDSRVQAWSTDPRSGVSGLPAGVVGGEDSYSAPECAATVVRGLVVYDTGVFGN